MKFELSSGVVISARQAWHDAFLSGVRSIDTQEVLNTLGVQFTAKGSDNCTMDHCDKGKIQQIIYNLKSDDKIAWAWGMFAYAPEGTENRNTLMNALLQFALESARTDEFNSFQSSACGRLAFAAIHDAAIEAWTDKRHRRAPHEMAAYCRCPVEEYKKEWRPIFFKMKNAIADLSSTALPPVARAVWLIVDKHNGDMDASERLGRAMKTRAA